MLCGREINGMKRIKILLVDGSGTGQPASVPRLWKSAFDLKGIEYYDVKQLSELEMPAESWMDYSVVILGSLPDLKSSDIAGLKVFAEKGGRIIASGPIGDAAGPSSEFCDLAGIQYPEAGPDSVRPVPGPVVPLLDTLVEPFQRSDLLLFLQDHGPVPDLEPTEARVIGGSLSWDSKAERYIKCDLPTIFVNEVGQGKVTYLAVALADESRIPPQRAGEYIPGGNAPGPGNIGHPYYSSLRAARLSFMTALICDAGTGYAGTGHWPNGWRIAITLSGDVHELDQYVNFQGGAARRMAEFLKSEDLDGLYTYSVTGEALDEEPELYNELANRGYEVVPHSTYEATWMNELSEEESLKEIDRCFEAFERHLPPESLLGWRSHGWSGNDFIEKQLDNKGVTWLSNLILHRYGEFGPRDRYVTEGNGIAFICMPEKAGVLSMVRLPNTYFSPDWIRTMIMGTHYGIARGPELDEVLCDLMKRWFYKDWRFEALHMVDWHPWEEFVDEPIFDRAVRDLVSLFKQTPNVGLINPTELTEWWNYRDGIRIKELKTGDSTMELTVTLPPNPTDTNPTVRIAPVDWHITSVLINEQIEWRFYGAGWIALPRNIDGEVKLTLHMGRPSALPVIQDTSAVVTVAEIRNDKVLIKLEEKRRQKGILTLFVPRPVAAELNGKKLDEQLMGHVTMPISRGRHELVLTPLMRTTVDPNKAP